MREIIFRGKRIDNGEWVEGFVYCFYNFTKRVTQILRDRTNGIPDAVEVILETVGQFTGLTDSNGDKIFEGDIVECAREDESLMVMWCEDTARFILSASTFCCDFDNYWGYEMEVIGNIHDNPELFGG